MVEANDFKGFQLVNVVFDHIAEGGRCGEDACAHESFFEKVFAVHDFDDFVGAKMGVCEGGKK